MGCNLLNKIPTSWEIPSSWFFSRWWPLFWGSSTPPTTIIGWRSNHNHIMGKMMVPLGWYPSCLTPRSPLKGDIPTKYPLYKVYIGSTDQSIMFQLAQFLIKAPQSSLLLRYILQSLSQQSNVASLQSLCFQQSTGATNICLHLEDENFFFSRIQAQEKPCQKSDDRLFESSEIISNWPSHISISRARDHSFQISSFGLGIRRPVFQGGTDLQKKNHGHLPLLKANIGFEWDETLLYLPTFIL